MPMPDTLEFNVQINRPVAMVYAYFAEPMNIIGLQPLLTWISPIQNAFANGVQTYRYETIETFRIGPIPVFNNRIKVKMLLTEPDQQIDTVVLGNAGLRLDVHYQFQPTETGTLLTERMSISVSAWVRSFVVDQARQVQTQTLANLKHKLESGPSADAFAYG